MRPTTNRILDLAMGNFVNTGLVLAGTPEYSTLILKRTDDCNENTLINFLTELDSLTNTTLDPAAEEEITEMCINFLEEHAYKVAGGYLLLSCRYQIAYVGFHPGNVADSVHAWLQPWGIASNILESIASNLFCPLSTCEDVNNEFGAYMHFSAAPIGAVFQYNEQGDALTPEQAISIYRTALAEMTYGDCGLGYCAVWPEEDTYHTLDMKYLPEGVIQLYEWYQRSKSNIISGLRPVPQE